MTVRAQTTNGTDLILTNAEAKKAHNRYKKGMEELRKRRAKNKK